MDDNKDFNLVTLEAWYATKLERDKHLFSISSVGLGLLVTLATSVGISSFYSGVAFCLASFSFLICICTVLWIFNANAHHLMEVVQGKDDSSQLLSILDKTAVSAFLLAIVFSMTLGVFSAFDKLSKESSMTDNKQNKTTFTCTAMDSFNGVVSMRKAMQQPTPSTNTNSVQKPVDMPKQPSNAKPSE
ncbi:TPA: hypothetical protein P0E15_004975 [Vibrio harveyi]|nr:hypothetical protein [Vibrio harveyi]